MHGMALANANANDKDELVPRPFRMSGFVPVNVPILIGFIAAPPTRERHLPLHRCSAHHVVDYFVACDEPIVQRGPDAGRTRGLNYGNKNSSSMYTYNDLITGYTGAVGSSVSVAVLLRLMTANISKGAKGPTLSRPLP